MARRFFPVTLTAALIQLGILILTSNAQTPAPRQSPSPSATPAQSPAAADNGKRGKEDYVIFHRENLSPDQQKKYDSLPADQQQKMRDNWEHWQNMPPWERKLMREAEQQRRQKMLQEIDDALKQSGLQLDDKAKEAYVLRYTQERHKIEQKLQKEMEGERKPLVQDLITRLKAEFQAKIPPSPAPAASPMPEPSATPSK